MPERVTRFVVVVGVLGIMCLLSACTANSSAIPPAVATQAAQLGMAPPALAYLNDALDIMEKNSLYRRQADWTTIRQTAYERARGATTLDATYPAIAVSLSLIGDRHSSFITPPEKKGLEEALAQRPTLLGFIVEERLGYLSVPGLRGGGTAADQTQFAADLQQLIQHLDEQQPCGWIVDLQGNPGGNMWPMLAGTGPLLGEGEVGHFVDPEGKVETWTYRDGKAMAGSTILTEAPHPYRLRQATPDVAVLIDRGTASSGEAIAVAFRGRPHTRFFGLPTAGISTANRFFPLKDGAGINLTTDTFADRSGTLYPRGVQPDETVEYNAFKAATAWLLEQPACQKQ